MKFIKNYIGINKKHCFIKKIKGVYEILFDYGIHNSSNISSLKASLYNLISLYNYKIIFKN